MIAQTEDDQVMNKGKLGDLYRRKGMCHYYAALTLGLKWKETGSEKPSGTEIKNELLAAALQTKLGYFVELTKEEWDKLQIPNLSRDSYIKAGNRYFILN